jgi:hypothetical protein
MKKLLLILALLSASAFAQVDIHINTIGPIRTIAQNVNWIGTGIGSLTNNYIFTPSYTNEGVCLYVDNNDSNEHFVTLQLFGTGDQTVTKYQGNTVNWALLGPTSNFFTGSGTTFILANTVKGFFIQASGNASVAIVFSSVGGTAGTNPTVNVNMVESQAGTSCTNATTGPVYCPQTVTTSVTSGSTVQLGPAGSTGEAVYVCNLTISASGALAAGNITLEYGTGATCTTPTVASVFLTATTTPVFLTMVGAPLQGRFNALGSDFAGLSLCVVNNQTTTIQATATIAQF